MGGPVLLIVRDGWGINPGGKEKREENGDATLLARTPFHDKLYRDYPASRLSASGADVGLPKGQMGNSEVGHLNPVAEEAFAAARDHRLHFLGLISDGGVHSHYSHLLALANAAQEAGVKEIFVHAFTDGRDASTTGGAEYLK